jgi:Na+/H+-dicarboxylate symporter
VKRSSRSLDLQVITAVVIGTVVGHVYPKFGVELKSATASPVALTPSGFPAQQA